MVDLMEISTSTGLCRLGLEFSLRKIRRGNLGVLVTESRVILMLLTFDLLIQS